MSIGGIIITGFTIGLLGSFHCIGMCGPITLVLPIQQPTISRRLTAVALYNLGRSLTYGAMGGLFGSLGYGLFMAGYQQLVSIILGGVMLLFIAVKYFTPYPIKTRNTFHQYIQQKLGGLLNSKNHVPYLWIGMINGFLPCGLVYIAIASAIATGNGLHGALLMFMFGLGTLPLMSSFMIVSKYLSHSFKTRMVKLIPVFTIMIAVLMILRGLNLNIPFISPMVKSMQGVSCH